MTVRDAIGRMPKIRSRISPTNRDCLNDWQIERAVGLALAGYDVGRRRTPAGWGGSWVPATNTIRADEHPYHDFVAKHSQQIGGVIQHMSRSHMAGDLRRYAFYAAKLKMDGRPQRVNDLPPLLRPEHKNVGRDDTPFTDRFRVQAWGGPSSTVVSHISKDGNYFIHPDPIQSRSLTVREAARLQSFPDDYYFCGSRTQQFHQVGNAVPPLLAHQIAKVVHDFLTL